MARVLMTLVPFLSLVLATPTSLDSQTCIPRETVAQHAAEIESLRAQLAAANAKVESIGTQLQKCQKDLDAKKSHQIPAKNMAAHARGEDVPKSTASVFKLDAESFKEQISSESKNLFVKFFGPKLKCPHCKQVAPEWKKLAEKYADHPVLLIAEVDCAQNIELCKAQGAEPLFRGRPVFKSFKMYAGEGGVLYRGGQNFVMFERQLKNERLLKRPNKYNRRPAEAAPKSTYSVFKLNTKSFKEQISSESKNLFLKFYGPKCHRCKRMAPDWRKLAEKYADHPMLLIAEVNCEHNIQLCQAQRVKTLPVVKHYKIGEGEGGVLYRGGQNFAMMQIWIKEHARLLQPR